MCEAIQKAVEENKVTLWLSTMGMSRMLPSYLLDAGWADAGKLICSIHPTDIDAKNAAEFDSTSSTSASESIAYSILFDDSSSPVSKILHISAQLLIEALLLDPLLTCYSVIILNDSHLRTLEIDLLLGLLKKILKKRSDIHLLISGATVDSLSLLSTYFADAAIVSLDTPTYPVDLHNIHNSTSDYTVLIIDTVLSLTTLQTKGCIVVFLPRREGYELQGKLLESMQNTGKFIKMHSIHTLSQLEKVAKAIEDTENETHIIITSLSPVLIARCIVIGTVIDSGFQEVTYTRYGFGHLAKLQPVSQETANLRAYIAGLKGPGRCYRLYAKEQFNSLQVLETPEIQRSCLDSFILRLKSLGVDNVLRFDYVSPPSSPLIAEAMDRLGKIGAIDGNATLTKPFGELLAQLPLRPFHGAMILKAVEHGCSEQIVSLIAVWLSKGEFFDHDKASPFITQEGDGLTWINIYQSFSRTESAKGTWCRKYGLSEQRLLRATYIKDQLIRILEYRGIGVPRSELATSLTIRRCIAAAYWWNSAYRLPNGFFRTMKGNLDVKIHPSSVLCNLTPNWIVFEEAVEIDGQIFVRNVTVIEKDWLENS